MNKRCKHTNKDGYRCGSYAFNLYKDDIDQGELCDVHYWQERALKAEALAQPEQEPVACAECERLRGELKKANDQAEHFEREWYLRGDEIEQLNAQPEQEPVATVTSETGADITMSWWHEPPLPIGTKLFTHPPQRTWVGLTNEEISELSKGHIVRSTYAKAVEAKLKEKNT
jgi:hypothetical protein